MGNGFWSLLTGVVHDAVRKKSAKKTRIILAAESEETIIIEIDTGSFPLLNNHFPDFTGYHQ